MSKSVVLLSAVLLFSLIFGGCSKGNESPSKTTSPSPGSSQTNESGQNEGAENNIFKQPPVELQYYYLGNPQPDVLAVQEEMNKILLEKINATIQLKQLDFANYGTKLNVMIGGGDKFDLVFTAPWIGNYFQNISKGAFLPLDDLLDQYAPQLKTSIPNKLWDATKVNGEIYGSINYQIVAISYGVGVMRELAEKYGLDVESIKKYEDLEPFLEQVKQNEKEIYPLFNMPSLVNQPTYYGFDTIGDDVIPGWVRLNDSNLEVINQYATDEYKEAVTLAHSWYEKGYVKKDIQSDLGLETGKFAVKNNLPIKPGVQAEEKNIWGGRDIVASSLNEPIITTNRAIATMTAISKTSPNPERAMMFLELINTDKTLYNLLAHGIEGKHYTKVSEDVIEAVPNSGYMPSTDWMFGNQFNGYYTSKEQVGVWEETKEVNANAKFSPILGFSFDPDPVKTEIAQTTTVIQQYDGPLSAGVGDPEKLLPEFLSKLEKAGLNKILAEKQKQLDAWKQSSK